MKKFNRIKLLVCVTVVMLMCCACSSKTDVSMNTDGKGVFKTQVVLEKELIELLGEQNNVQNFDLVQALNEHKIDGVDLEVKSIKNTEKEGVEISFSYNNIKEFNDIIGKINKYFESFYGESEEEYVDIEDENETLASKSVNVYLEDATFKAAVEEYLLNNGISVDKNSNTFRKFMKLFKSTIKSKLEYTDEEEFDEEYDEEYYDDFYDEEFEDNEEGLLDVNKDGYAIINNGKDNSVLKLHCFALESISSYVYFVLGTYLPEDVDESLEVDEGRKQLFIKAFEQMNLAQKIKESFVTDENTEVEYKLENMTPGQIIDIFTDEYMDDINNVIEDIFPDDESDGLYDEELEDVEGPDMDITYNITFGNTTVTYDEDRIIEESDDAGYLTIVSKDKVQKLSSSDEFDKTPKTSDGFSIVMAAVVALVAFAMAVVFYTRKRAQ